MVKKLKGFKGAVTWRSTSAHSGHGAAQQRHWGLEVAIAEQVHEAIKDAPPQPQLDFAKPAYVGEQDASIKAYLEKLLAGQEELKQGQMEITRVVRSVGKVLSLAMLATFASLTTLASLASLAPRLPHYAVLHAPSAPVKIRGRRASPRRSGGEYKPKTSCRSAP